MMAKRFKDVWNNDLFYFKNKTDGYVGWAIVHSKSINQTTGTVTFIGIGMCSNTNIDYRGKSIKFVLYKDESDLSVIERAECFISTDKDLLPGYISDKDEADIVFHDCDCKLK